MTPGCNVAMYLRSELKGSVSRRIGDAVNPAVVAPTRSAASVGSPMISPLSAGRESLQASPATRHSRAAALCFRLVAARS
jgi:hypothetical protein